MGPLNMDAFQEQYARFRAMQPFRRKSVEGGWFEYVDCGAGPPVLLLSGLFGKGESWFPLILALKEEYRFIAPSYTALEDLDSFFSGLMQIVEEEAQLPVHVVGHSFGGLLSQGLVRSHGGSIGSVVLSHTSLPDSSRVGYLEKMARFLLRLPFPLHRRLWGWRIGHWTRGRETSAGEFWSQYRRQLLSSLRREDLVCAYRYFLDLLKDYRFQENELEGWSGPMLIIESEDDAAIPEKERTKLRQSYPGAEVHTFERAGHSSLIEKPGEYITVIQRFFAHSEQRVSRADTDA
ncbi:MAG: alpha/beta fold hydrolase [Acidobacteriota bacterium]